MAIAVLMGGIYSFMALLFIMYPRQAIEAIMAIIIPVVLFLIAGVNISANAIIVPRDGTPSAIDI